MLLENKRRVVLHRGEFSPDPRELRRSLSRLEGLLSGTDSGVRRRVGLTFTELIGHWHRVADGGPLVLSLELLPEAIRLTAFAERKQLTEAEWESLVAPVALEFIDAWGLDRRHPGAAWFEFWSTPGKRPADRSATS